MYFFSAHSLNIEYFSQSLLEVTQFEIIIQVEKGYSQFIFWVYPYSSWWWKHSNHFISSLLVLTDNASCIVLAFVSSVSITNLGFPVYFRKRFCCYHVSRSLTFLLKNSYIADWLPLTFPCCDIYIIN